MQLFENQSAYEYHLRKRGFVKIGGGLYAEVYAKPGSDKCIKVARSSDAWPEYVEWATLEQYAGVYAPKVYSLKFHNGFYVALMERLVCTIADIHASHPTYHYSKHPLSDLVASVQTWSGYGGREVRAEAEGLKSFCNAVKTQRLVSDLHDGNIMLRKDGQLVITDPSSSCQTRRPRIKAGTVIQQSE